MMRPLVVPYEFPPDALHERVYRVSLTPKISSLYSFEGDIGSSLFPRLHAEIEEWIIKNVKHMCGIQHLTRVHREDPQLDHAIWFENDTEAVMFKVRWS